MCWPRLIKQVLPGNAEQPLNKLMSKYITLMSNKDDSITDSLKLGFLYLYRELIQNFDELELFRFNIDISITAIHEVTNLPLLKQPNRVTVDLLKQQFCEYLYEEKPIEITLSAWQTATAPSVLYVMFTRAKDLCAIDKLLLAYEHSLLHQDSKIYLHDVLHKLWDLLLFQINTMQTQYYLREKMDLLLRCGTKLVRMRAASPALIKEYEARKYSSKLLCCEPSILCLMYNKLYLETICALGNSLEDATLSGIFEANESLKQNFAPYFHDFSEVLFLKSIQPIFLLTTLNENKYTMKFVESSLHLPAREQIRRKLSEDIQSYFADCYGITAFKVAIFEHKYLGFYEYINGGNLTDRAKHHADCIVNLFRDALELAKSLLKLVIALAQNHIIFPDLKPDNILFSKYGEIKIADDKTLRLLTREQLGQPSVDIFDSLALEVTQDFMPPEFYKINRNKLAESPRDMIYQFQVYLLGITLYHYIENTVPMRNSLEHHSEPGTHQMVFSDGWSQTAEGKQLKLFIQQCTRFLPTLRSEPQALEAALAPQPIFDAISHAC